MKILFYLGHPAQFHFCKNIILSLLQDKHQVKILIKTKDVLEKLLEEAGFEFENIQDVVRKNDKKSILLAALKRTFKVYNVARYFKADLLVGTDSSVAQAAFLLRKKSFTVLEDDYAIIKNLARLTYPFSSAIIVPSVCKVGKRWENKKIPYQGYMKLAYLHPKWFVPDKTIVERYACPERYCLIRLAKLTAHHDVGINGLPFQLVKDVVRIIEEKGYHLYISSESELEESLQKYQLEIHKNDIHHLVACSSLLISDSQSMSVEAAMLGVPSIRYSDFAGRISVLDELEFKYGLTFGVSTQSPEKMLTLVDKLLADTTIKETFENRRRKMLSDKIDVTAFFVWLIENYPDSAKILKVNPNYQFSFK